MKMKYRIVEYDGFYIAQYQYVSGLFGFLFRNKWFTGHRSLFLDTVERYIEDKIKRENNPPKMSIVKEY